jgi:hypothetical protein
VHARAIRRISHLQTLDDGLNGLRLILISAPKKVCFCKIFPRTGRPTDERRRDATPPRCENIDNIYHIKVFLAQACRETRQRRPLQRAQARNRLIFCFFGFFLYKEIADDGPRASQCAASARFPTRAIEKYMYMVYAIEFLAARHRRIVSTRT